MKKYVFGMLFMASMITFSCQSKNSDSKNITKNTSTEEVLETRKSSGKTTIYHVDRDKSYINWKGTKPTGSHQGKVKFNFGRMAADPGVIHGAELTVDMATITVENEDPETTAKLENHLKSADFFEVENYPFAEMKIAQIQPFDGSEGYNYTLKGQLRIKNVTKNVTVPVNVEFGNDKIVVSSPTFMINRTEWGITYRSGVINTVKDKLIDDEIELSIYAELYPRQQEPEG